jgi:cell division protein ZapA
MTGGKNTFRIHIKIDGRTYPLEINRIDEERYRLAAKIVNETVEKYRKLFPDNDSKDILAMASFQIALNVAELKNQGDRTLFIEDLKNINDDISDFLKEKIEE